MRLVPPDENQDKTATIQEGQQNTLNNEIKKAKEQDACLILIRGSPQGNRFFLTKTEMVIGRDPKADISISDYRISRKHAQLLKNKENIFLLDLKSSNGTFINNKLISAINPTLLSKEDIIKVGNTIFKFIPAGELEILLYGKLGLAAYTDSLTKIYNRGYLNETLEAEFKRAKALQQDLSLIFFDLDHFKNINDAYGHDAGDFVLQEMAKIIQTKHIRPKDIFGRYGGEEFILILSGTPGHSATELAERIRIAIEVHPFIYENKRLPVTISMGVAEIEVSSESCQSLIKNADKALYIAKNNGRNQVVKK